MATNIEVRWLLNRPFKNPLFFTGQEGEVAPYLTATVQGLNPQDRLTRDFSPPSVIYTLPIQGTSGSIGQIEVFNGWVCYDPPELMEGIPSTVIMGRRVADGITPIDSKQVYARRPHINYDRGVRLTPGDVLVMRWIFDNRSVHVQVERT